MPNELICFYLPVLGLNPMYYCWQLPLMLLLLLHCKDPLFILHFCNEIFQFSFELSPHNHKRYLPHSIIVPVQGVIQLFIDFSYVILRLSFSYFHRSFLVNYSLISLLLSERQFSERVQRQIIRRNSSQQLFLLFALTIASLVL